MSDDARTRIAAAVRDIEMSYETLFTFLELHQFDEDVDGEAAWAACRQQTSKAIDEVLREAAAALRLRSDAPNPVISDTNPSPAGVEAGGPLDQLLSEAQLKLRNGYDDALSRAIAEARNLLNGVEAGGPLRALIAKWRVKADEMCPVIPRDKLPHNGWTATQNYERVIGGIIGSCADELEALLAAPVASPEAQP